MTQQQHYSRLLSCLILTIGLFCNPLSQTVQGQCSGVNVQDSLALVALYNATDGDNWTANTNWLIGTVGTWHGVTLTSDGCGVEDLELVSNNLNGTIPLELGNLTNLTSLRLYLNQLSGAIPEELGNLSNLTHLNLGNNQLSGTIPLELGNLSNLIYLDLHENQLSGAIPEELSNLSNLTNLLLYNNQLSGAIPIELGNLSNLGALFLYNNQLSGAIPEELGNLSNLGSLRLQDNQLSGCLPDELQELCNNGTFGNISNNPDLATQDWSAFCDTGEGACSISSCDPTSSGGTVSIQPGLEGYTASLGLFCGDASVRLDVADAVLPNDTYESVFMVTDAALNIVAYAPSSNGENGVGLFGILPAGDYSGWYVVYSTIEYPVLPPVGSTAAVFGGVADDGTGCLALGGPVNFSVAEIIGVQILGFECVPGEGYLPIVLGSGGCPEETGFGSYSLNAGFVSGAYVSGVGIIGTLQGGTPTGDGQTVTLSVTADGCTCGSETVVATTPTVACGATTTDCITVDSLTLVTFYNSTNGDNWINNSNWLTGNVSDWFGVTMTDDGCGVEGLNLGGNQLSGSIPPELGNLTNLDDLNLYSNQLSGNIPSELGNLANLSNLILGKNQLTGSIPPELGGLSNLINLYLFENQLTDTLPLELGNLVNLVDFRAYENQLTGNIPDEMGNLINLTVFSCHMNQLTGNIPDEIGNLINLVLLGLSSNQLSGNIPNEIGNLTNLTTLGLSTNQLSGAIPNEIGTLINLDTLYLYSNQLSGAIPNEMGALTNLSAALLYDNQLSGTIPSELANLNNLTNLQLNNNQLNGILPIGLSNLNNLTFLALQNNQFIFEDFAPHYNNWINLTGCETNPCFRYAPQDTIPTYLSPDAANLYVIAGDVANNTYTWYEQGNPIPLFISMLGDSLYTPTANGIYYCEVTNGIMTDPSEEYHNLVLTSEPFVFTLSTGNAQITLTAYLQGAFAPPFTDTEMDNNLQTAGLLPNDQPYDMLPWDYSGTENLTDLPSSVAVVDWVLVELVTIGLNGQGDLDTLVVAQQAALLTTTGEVVNTLGAASLSFEGLDWSEEYYVLLRHRNHLDVVSAMPYDLSVGSLNLDFSDPMQVMQADNGDALLQLIEVSTATGIHALRAGDFDGNGVFNIADYNMWLVENFSFNQYALEDCNLDGLIFIQDHVFFSANYTVIGMPMVKY